MTGTWKEMCWAMWENVWVRVNEVGKEKDFQWGGGQECLPKA